jgi:hypothetical protein
MRAKELKRCLSSQSQVFSSLDESKTNKPTLEPIMGCFHSLDESQRRSPYLRLISQLDESKRAEKTLELAIHKNESKRAEKMLEPPPPRNLQIKSKRAEKMLELTLSQVFSGLDESKKAEKPTLDLS